MDHFYSLLCHCWGGDVFDESKIDLIMNLPLEISIMILRLLDPKTLLAAIMVNRRWCRLIRSDCVLRGRVYDGLKKRRVPRTSGAHAGSSSLGGFFTRINNCVKTTHICAAPAREIFLYMTAAPVPARSARPAAGGPQPLGARQPFTVPKQHLDIVWPKHNARFTFKQTNSQPVGNYSQPAADVFGKSTEARRQSRTSKATKYRPSKKLSTNVNSTSLRL